jgi:hypothetical protein
MLKLRPGKNKTFERAFLATRPLSTFAIIGRATAMTDATHGDETEPNSPGEPSHQLGGLPGIALMPDSDRLSMSPAHRPTKHGKFRHFGKRKMATKRAAKKKRWENQVSQKEVDWSA